MVSGDNAPTLSALRARREDLLRIAAAHGAHDVRIFGSVARDEAGPASDVDFLVNLDADRTLFDLSGLILDLKDALGHNVDVIELTQFSPIGKRIEREALPL